MSSEMSSVEKKLEFLKKKKNSRIMVFNGDQQLNVRIGFGAASGSSAGSQPRSGSLVWRDHHSFSGRQNGCVCFLGTDAGLALAGLPLERSALTRCLQREPAKKVKAKTAMLVDCEVGEKMRWSF